ncbi:MAG TPA: hypothetical protein PK772_02485 [Chitinophagaceae bacterium]|nr:hypothetical protein [Chitinophagaceae bacterium]
MKIKFILYNLILCGILLVSCKPDYSFEKGITPPPVIKKPTQIITIGRVSTGPASTFMCWIDSVPFTPSVPTNATLYSIGDVEKQNNNTILVGSYSDRTRENPCYWENGFIHDLPLTFGENSGRAIAVKARNNILYIFGYGLGWPTGVFYLWTISNGVVGTLRLTLPPSIVIDGADVYRSTMCLAGNDLFIVSQGKGIGKYGYTSVPFYWKIDENNVSNAFLLENPNNVDFTLFSGGDVSATGKVYAAGPYGIFPLRTGGIWTQQGRMNLSTPLDIPYGGGYQSIKIDNNNNNLYVRKSSTHMPELSIVTPQGQITEKTFSLPTNHIGQTATIDIQNGIHVVGITCVNFTNIGPNRYAFIDKDGTHIPLLGINTNVDVIVLYRTKIFNQ